MVSLDIKGPKTTTAARQSDRVRAVLDDFQIFHQIWHFIIVKPDGIISVSYQKQ